MTPSVAPKPAKSQAASRTDEGLHLLIVLPALNEQETIGEVIRGIPRPLPGIGRISVLVIDDGSTDQTAARAREAGAFVIHHGQTRGVGATFHTALAYAADNTPDILLSMDSDGQFDPRHIPTLLAPVLSGQADFATVSRFKDPALVPEMPWLRRWGNRMLARLVSRIAGQTYYDVACGMRCYSRHAAMHLNLMGRFSYTAETFLNLAFKGLRIAEVPLPVRGNRQHGKSRVARSLFKYGWRMSRIIFRCYRDYRPMPFFGGIALALFVPALGLEIFALIHYLQTGSLTPHKWAAFTGLGLCLLSVAALQLGMVGDMLNRHRIYLEELLYERRMRPHRRNDDA
jgi:glycosyltransferase involved in cell wall biosynthesis